MKVLILLLLVLLPCAQSLPTLKECIQTAFTSTCKIQLYNCFNNSDCSYQLHTNTQHIFITNTDTTIPPIYFSNPTALLLHKCLESSCNIGPIDKVYPSTLPLDACLLEVWDACGGDVQEVYEGRGESNIRSCFRGYCPTLGE